MESNNGGGRRSTREPAVAFAGKKWYVFFVEQFIHHNGYLTVFISVALAGEVGLFAGAALARTGAVTLTGVVLLGTAASFIANTIYFYAGRSLWNRWKFLREKFGNRVERSSGVVRRYGSPLMLVARFFYGIRDIVPLALGLYRVEPGLFTLYNIIGAFAWAYAFTVLGDAISGILKRVSGNIGFLFLVGAGLAVVILAVYLLIRRRVSTKIH